MPRVAAPELEDYPWWPVLWRDAMTDFLQKVSDVFGLFDAVVPLVEELLTETGAEQIVDLCSGGGGPAVRLVEQLQAHHGRAVRAVLTDKYPNALAFERAEARAPAHVAGRREPTDATAVPEELRGLRTLFNALHHFPPAAARGLFADAAQKRQPIATFELVERSPAMFGLMAGLPAAVATLTPFIEPRSLGRLTWTYAVPVIPLTTAWDGFASCLRAYSPDELHALVDGLGDAHYRFRVERRRIPRLPVSVTSLIGVPC